MIVPDASAILLLFTPADLRSALADRLLMEDPAWVVPDHWHTEVLSGIRGLALGGHLTSQDAEMAVRWLARATVAVTPASQHLARMWELRANRSAHDAGYVAVAEQHHATLVTADARILNAGVAPCEIDVIA